MAPLGRRLSAFAIDCLASYLVATLITRSTYTGLWSTVVFFSELVVLGTLTGQSFGMRITGLRVVRTTGRPAGPIPVLVRTALLLLFIPALLWDRDSRGLHDRAAGTLIVRTRN